MDPISGYPYQELQFTKKGKVFKQTEIDDLKQMIADHKLTDLLVISHGWLTDIGGARGFYTKLAASLRMQQDSRSDFGDRKIGILGILWPSLKWAEAEELAGGAATVGDEDAALEQMLDDLKGFFDDDDADEVLAEAKALLPGLGHDKNKQAEFVDKIRSLLSAEAGHDEDLDEALFTDFANAPGEEVLDKLSEEDDIEDLFEEEGEEGEHGGATGLFSGIRSGVRSLLNVTTFYQMKKRSGVVGTDGLNPVLKDLAALSDAPRLHLIGHSFGGRLVTATANGSGGQTDLKVDSLCLLQAAFSHNGFATDFKGTKDGLFVPVVTGDRIKGCTFVTHSKKDNALKLPYAVASRLAGQNAAGVGSVNDPFGAIGSNGAQHVEVDDNTSVLLEPGKPYTFTPGKLCNLKGDEHISSHGDVKNPAVANAILWAVSIT